MTVLPVSSFEFRKRPGFEGKREKKQGLNEVPVNNPETPNHLKAAPIIVLMAMNPALLNAELPGYEQMFNQIQTESIAKTPNQLQLPKIKKIPVSEKFKPERVIYEKKFKENGKGWTLYYTSVLKKSKPNNVMWIHIVPDGFENYAGEDGYEITSPPAVSHFIYHKVGSETKFVGASVTEVVKEGKGFVWKKHEIRLPDEMGNAIKSLLSNETEFVPNKNQVNTLKIVNTTDLEKPEIKPWEIEQKYEYDEDDL